MTSSMGHRRGRRHTCGGSVAVAAAVDAGADVAGVAGFAAGSARGR